MGEPSSIKQRQQQAYERFNQYLALDTHQQAAFLERIKDLEPQYFEEIQRLIDAASETDSGLSDKLGNILNQHFTEYRVGSMIGGYRVLRELGSGGMGVVLLARQERPQRDVALKLIKAGPDAGHIDRFRREQQVLANLEHPGIATIFEIGITDQDLPFFAMEYIDGLPLTRYCDHHQLDIPARLKLFLAVCRAVSYAHQNGVIHRDLKPSNIMVHEVDGQPVVKVIDFGIARILSEADIMGDDTTTDQPASLSRTGVVMGSPRYMSPEQAEGRGATCDTRGDLYSLGIILHELLLGGTPDNMVTDGYSQILSGLREEGERIARERGCSVATLRKLTGGDLDWILSRALQVNKTDRYATIDAMAQDITCFLQRKPVSVAPPALLYPLRLFAARNKLLVTTILMVATVLSAGLGGTIWGLVKARKEAINAQYTVTILQDVLSSVEPDQSGRDLKVHELLAAFESRLNDNSIKEQTRATLHYTYARTYMELGMYNEAEPHAEKAVALREGFMDQGDLQLMEAHVNHLELLTRLGRIEKGIPLGKALLTRYEKERGMQSPLTSEIALLLANLEFQKGKLREAERLIRQVLMERRQNLGNQHPDTLESMSGLAAILTKQGHFKEAAKIQAEVVSTSRQTIGETKPNTLVAGNILGYIHLRAGFNKEAEGVFREVLANQEAVMGKDHPSTVSTAYGLADALVRREQFEESLPHYERVYERYREVYGETNSRTLFALSDLAESTSEAGHFGGAENLFLAGRELAQFAWGSSDGRTLRLEGKYATHLAAIGKREDAMVLFNQSLAAWQGPADEDWLDLKYRFAKVQADWGCREAGPMLEELLLKQRDMLGEHHYLTLRTMASLTTFRRDQGRKKLALQTASVHLEAVTSVFGEDHEKTQSARILFEEINRL